MELVGDKHYECNVCGIKTLTPGLCKCALLSGREDGPTRLDPMAYDAFAVIEQKLNEILDQQRWLEQVILERLG